MYECGNAVLLEILAIRKTDRGYIKTNLLVCESW